MLKYESEVRQLLRQVLGLPTTKDIPLKENLEKWGMDSLNSIQLAILLEDRLQTVIPEEKLDYQSFRNIQNICDMLEEIGPAD